MTEQQKFINASEQERQKMIQLFQQQNVIHYEFTPSTSYDRIDGYYTGKTGSEYVFEVKVRTNDASAYTYTTMIEENKLQNLIKESSTITHKPIIFFFFRDDTCYYQDVFEDVHYQAYWRDCPATTMGKKTLVPKRVVDFRINREKLITLKNG